MRKITKEYTVYDYNDIVNNESLKQKILEKHYSINVDFEWYEPEFEYWTDKLESFGYIKPEINFELYCQGAGASFTCSYVDINKLAATSGEFTDREVNILTTLANYGYIECNIKRNTHHYAHEYTIYADFYDGNMRTSWTHIQKVVDKLNEYIKTNIIELSRMIYSDLNNEYEYLTSEKAILETIQANEYEFYESGEIAA